MKSLITMLIFTFTFALQAQEETSKSKNSCTVEEGFKEPMKAKRLKKFIAVDLDLEDITAINTNFFIFL